ncbi:MAG: hypothetical protein SPL15_04310 [Lachnospiraceae bacterium]|nr:hypothetical protein [Lachnospiraceae bacterium]MDY5742201.1 hypothetical protein [Lachnospiraceae bacterium]
MKKWKKRASGVCAFVLAMSFSITAFADVRVVEKNQVVASVAPSITEINIDNRVTEITDEEYSRLTLGDLPFQELRAADVDSKVTLDGLDHRSYRFNMVSVEGYHHDGFTIKISDVSCAGEVDYAIIVKQDSKVIIGISCNHCWAVK